MINPDINQGQIYNSTEYCIYNCVVGGCLPCGNKVTECFTGNTECNRETRHQMRLGVGCCATISFNAAILTSFGAPLPLAGLLACAERVSCCAAGACGVSMGTCFDTMATACCGVESCCGFRDEIRYYGIKIIAGLAAGVLAGNIVPPIIGMAVNPHLFSVLDYAEIALVINGAPCCFHIENCWDVIEDLTPQPPREQTPEVAQQEPPTTTIQLPRIEIISTQPQTTQYMLLGESSPEGGIPAPHSPVFPASQSN